MRFFIALEIPDTSRNEIKKVQEQLKHLIPKVRLTETSKLHLTLAFVGEEPEDMKANLVEVMKIASENIPPFTLTPAYIDAFPNIHNPDTFWIGVKGDIDKLLLIRERIKDGLNNLSLLVDERRFTPHIAIGKVKNFHLDSRTENTLASFMAKHFDPIRIENIKLFESIPDEGFHRHNTLAEIHLKKN